jgi:hypothetical protein
MSHPLAEQLAEEFIRDFSSADREIEWLAAEEECSLWLTPQTVLVGRRDARGRTGDGDPFFGEWKSLSNYKARYIEEEKIKWRTDPQALTYGVLSSAETHRFTVRWAIKPDAKGRGMGTAFEWYTYTPSEVEHWKGQLIQIADEIRRLRLGPAPWRTNFGNCYRYGVKYACPFVDDCNAQRWQPPSVNPRIPHLKIEPEIRNTKWDKDPYLGGGLAQHPEKLVILDASRVGDYLDCPHAYLRKWEGEGYQETSEALTIGTDFHALVAQHIKSLIREQPHART